MDNDSKYHGAPMTPEGLTPPSGLKDDEAGDGLSMQERIEGTPKSKAESLGMGHTGGDQKPAGPAKGSIKGTGTRSGMTFDCC